jgi:REP element-mobilizing transposase RayT
MDPDVHQRIRPGPPRLTDFDYSNPEVVYFVTACAASGTPFVNCALASIVIDELQWLRSQRGICLYAYCLMPDHLHILLQLPGRTSNSPDDDVAGATVLRRGPPQTLGSVMATLKGYTTHESWKAGYEGKLWQTNFYDHILRGYESGIRVAEYILESPVRAGLVRQPDDYPWSGRPDPL